jgi:hypothetical protein
MRSATLLAALAAALVAAEDDGRRRSYRVCFAPPGKPRPREFATKPGSSHTLHVWKRVKD